jgi:hypothetical protein
MAHMPGPCQHATRPVTFTLVVNDFGIKYVGKQHANHLCQVRGRCPYVSIFSFCGCSLNVDVGGVILMAS